jgi:hypothetical protein
MEQEWSWPNKDKTEIIRTITNGVSGGKMNRIPLQDVGGSANHTDENLLASGALPHIYPELGEYEIFGDLKIESDRISKHLIQKPADEIRAFIRSEIYRISKQYIDQPASNYSQNEAIEWANDRAQYRAGNIGHFAMRAGQYMTAQQYVDTKLKPKIEAGSYFSEQIKGIRTDLLFELANTADQDLPVFDYVSRWDDVGDFVAPEPVDVPVAWWNELMSSIQFWKN